MRQPAYLTRSIIHDGRIITGLNTVCITPGGTVAIAPFDTETHTTVYHDGPVAVVRADAVTDTLIDDLESLCHDPVRILAYLKAAGLMTTAEAPRGAVMLPL